MLVVVYVLYKMQQQAYSVFLIAACLIANLKGDQGNTWTFEYLFVSLKSNLLTSWRGNGLNKPYIICQPLQLSHDFLLLNSFKIESKVIFHLFIIADATEWVAYCTTAVQRHWGLFHQKKNGIKPLTWWVRCVGVLLILLAGRKMNCISIQNKTLHDNKNHWKRILFISLLECFTEPAADCQQEVNILSVETAGDRRIVMASGYSAEWADSLQPNRSCDCVAMWQTKPWDCFPNVSLIKIKTMPCGRYIFSFILFPHIIFRI